MLGVFAEFERSIIQERIHAGLARAREKGTKSGKPIGRARIEATKEAAIRIALASGKGILTTARDCGTGVSVVQRIKGEVARDNNADARGAYFENAHKSKVAVRFGPSSKLVGIAERRLQGA